MQWWVQELSDRGAGAAEGDAMAKGETQLGVWRRCEPHDNKSELKLLKIFG